MSPPKPPKGAVDGSPWREPWGSKAPKRTLSPDRGDSPLPFARWAYALRCPLSPLWGSPQRVARSHGSRRGLSSIAPVGAGTATTRDPPARRSTRTAAVCRRSTRPESLVRSAAYGYRHAFRASDGLQSGVIGRNACQSPFFASTPGRPLFPNLCETQSMGSSARSSGPTPPVSRSRG